MINSKTFRLFISSTFNDFRHERQILHEKVFPLIDKYCHAHGFTFQPIDLRWGVSYETQLDQKTLKLCLDEVRMCKHFVHPNFIIMSGNRYGWVPLPYAIEESEFELIVKYHEQNTKALELLKQWYILDTNNLLDDSHAYVINPREEDLIWEPIEDELRTYLQEAASALFKSDTPEYIKYFQCATEAEVQEGIFQYLDQTGSQKQLQNEGYDASLDKEHVFGFIRRIQDIASYDTAEEPASFYIDKDQENVELFHQRIQDSLEDDKILFQDISLPQTTEASFEQEYLVAFEAFMLAKLMHSIKMQIAQVSLISALEQERSEQSYFLSLKSEVCFGRDVELQKISDYVSSSSEAVFMVHGKSGLGKTSLTAKAIKQMQGRGLSPLYRFVGATASSSSYRSLLISIVEELAEKNLLLMPDVFEEDSNQFNEQIKLLLLSVREPLVLVLDALDQLQENDYLQWLPIRLPSNIKIIISALDEEGYDFYYNLLLARLSASDMLCLKALDVNAASATIDALLAKEKRTLHPEQKRYVLECFQMSGASPLYLKMAFEEFKTWKHTPNQTSNTQNYELSIGTQEIIVKFVKNLSSIYHHPDDVVQKIIAYISASLDGLSEKALLELLSRNESVMKNAANEYHSLPTTIINGDEKPKFPVSIWARLHEQLQALMYERVIDAQNLLIFSHRKVREAFKAHCYEAEKRLVHEELANYFLSLNVYSTSSQNHYDIRSLSELAYQQLMAQQYEALSQTLCDLEFAGEVYDTHKHKRFREAAQRVLALSLEETGSVSQRVELFEQFYREKEHLILKYDEADWTPKQSLFGLAYEDAKDSLISEKAEALAEKKANEYWWLKNLWRDETPYRSGLLHVMHGHTANINGFIKLKNETLISWDLDNVFRVWDAKGQLKNEIELHQNRINGVIELPDESLLSFSADSSIYVWEMQKKRFHKFEHHSASVNGVVVLKDGSLLSYSDDATLQKFNHADEQSLLFSGHTSAIRGAQELSDFTILSWSDDNTLKLWNQEGECLNTLHGHTQKIQGAIELQNGNILSYSSDKSLREWSGSGEFIASWLGHSGNVLGAIELQDGNVLSYSRDKSLKIWNKDGVCLHTLKGHKAYITSVLELKNGNIISSSRDKTLILWSAYGSCLKVLKGHTDTVSSVIELEDETLLSYGEDMSMILWSQEGKLLKIIQGHSGIVSRVVALDKNTVLSSSWDQTLRLWSLKDAVAYSEAVGHKDKIENLLVCQNANILSWSWDETLVLWSKDGEVLRSMKGHQGTINGAIELKDKKLLSWSKDTTLILWGKNGEKIKQVQGHTGIIAGAQQLKNNNIVTWSWDHTLRLWDENLNELSVLQTHTQTVFGARELRDGTIISYSFDGTMGVWNSDGTLVAKTDKEMHSDWIMGVTLLEDETIVTYSKDFTIKRWNTQAELLAEYTTHTDVVREVLSLSEERFVSYADDLTLCFWRKDGVLIQQSKAHEKNINGILHHKDGFVLSYSDDTTLKMWDTDGVLLKTLQGHYAAVVEIVVLQNRSFISLDDDGCMIFWTAAGAKIQYFPMSNDGRIIKKVIVQENTFIAIEHEKIYKYSLMHGNDSIAFDEVQTRNTEIKVVENA